MEHYSTFAKVPTAVCRSITSHHLIDERYSSLSPFSECFHLTCATASSTRRVNKETGDSISLLDTIANHTLAYSNCHMSLSSDTNDFTKGTQLATPPSPLGHPLLWSILLLVSLVPLLMLHITQFRCKWLHKAMPASPKPSWLTSPPVYCCAHLTCPILMLHIAQFRHKQLCKGDSISHPLWYACFPPSLHGCLLHWFILVLASFIPPLVSCPAQHLVSFLGPILSAWAPLCTDATLIWLFYHFKINFWGDKVYYTELCTGIQWFILMYSTLDFQFTLHWKNRKNTADIKCDVHRIQVWFTLRISEWYQCDSPGDPVHITLDCTVCITSDLCVRIFCSVLWLTVSSSWLEFPWLHP